MAFFIRDQSFFGQFLRCVSSTQFGLLCLCHSFENDLHITQFRIIQSFSRCDYSWCPRWVKAYERIKTNEQNVRARTHARTQQRNKQTLSWSSINMTRDESVIIFGGRFEIIIFSLLNQSLSKKKTIAESQENLSEFQWNSWIRVRCVSICRVNFCNFPSLAAVVVSQLSLMSERENVSKA